MILDKRKLFELFKRLERLQPLQHLQHLQPLKPPPSPLKITSSKKKNTVFSASPGYNFM